MGARRPCSTASPQHQQALEGSRDAVSTAGSPGRDQAAFRSPNSSLLPQGTLKQQLPQKALAGVRSDFLPKKGSRGRWGVQTGMDL